MCLHTPSLADGANWECCRTFRFTGGRESLGAGLNVLYSSPTFCSPCCLTTGITWWDSCHHAFLAMMDSIPFWFWDKETLSQNSTSLSCFCQVFCHSNEKKERMHTAFWNAASLWLGCGSPTWALSPALFSNAPSQPVSHHTASRRVCLDGVRPSPKPTPPYQRPASNAQICHSLQTKQNLAYYWINYAWHIMCPNHFSLGRGFGKTNTSNLQQ